MDDLLTLKQVPSGREPDFVSFELPISYHAATNIAAVLLLIDPAEDISEEFESENVECTLATNGNCLLTWNTSFDTYGQHALQAALVVEEKEEPVQLLGPVVPFFSTNICQFNPAYARFNPAGATLFARLPESNGVYQIELKSPDGVLLKTFSGTTSNGVIKHHWDLVDDHGQRYTNNAFDGIFHITLPDSGRSQTSVQ